jgi:hypothetical protein
MTAKPDRLAEIKNRAAAYRGISDTPLLDDSDCDWLIAEVERLRAFQAEIFEVYGGNYEPEGRLKDLTAVIERAMSQR